MCTLVLVWRVFDDAPVVVAANRDEATDRPAEPPTRWNDEGAGTPTVVAPRDAEAGGTWIGHTDTGLFVGIANRWTEADLAGERSRGLLVADALDAGAAAAAADRVEAAVERHEYAGFNLLVADAADAVLLRWDGDLERVAFEAGLHVVTNAGYDDTFEVPHGREAPARRQARTARAVAGELAPVQAETAEGWLDRAADVLGDHDLGVCVHGDGYGTRSSSLVALRADGTATFEYADGPPCETAFEAVEGQS